MTTDFKQSLHAAVKAWLIREGVDCAEVTNVYEYHDEGANCESCGWEPFDEARFEYIDSTGEPQLWCTYDKTLGQVIQEILKGWE